MDQLKNVLKIRQLLMDTYCKQGFSVGAERNCRLHVMKLILFANPLNPGNGQNPRGPCHRTFGRSYC